MRTVFIIPLVLMSLVSSPSWGLSMDDLVEREDLYYQKFTDVPFAGEINEGKSQGNFKHGKKEGLWVRHLLNGQLISKGAYENDKEDGEWVSYTMDGEVFPGLTGNYSNGVKLSD